MATTNVEKLTSIVLNSAHSQGVLELSKRQIETLGLLLRGVNAVKKKYYAQTELHLKIALIQENIFKSIGLGLDLRYLQSANQLSLQHEHKKKVTPENKHLLLGKWYQAELVALRNEYQIDQQIDMVLEQFSSNEVFQNKIIDQFLNHVGMGFIEKDIDVEVQKDNESSEEFKTKQLINERIGLYHALRKNYTDEITKIDQDFSNKRKVPFQEIQTELDDIESRYQKLLKEKLTEEDLIRFSPEEKIQQMLTQQAKNLTPISPVSTDTDDEANRRMRCEYLVYNIIENDKDVLPTDLSKALDYLFEKSLETIIKERQFTQQDKQKKINKAELKIQDKLTVIEKEKEIAINAAKQKYALQLDEAEKYFKDEILILVKELNALKANSLFFSTSNQIEALIDAHRDSTQMVDAYTISFIVSMRRLILDLSRIDAQHLGMQIANQVLIENIGPKEEVIESKMALIFNLAAQKVGDEIGAALAQSDPSMSRLRHNVSYLENTSHLKIPKELSTQPFQSLIDFLPPITPSPTPTSQKDNFIDLAKSFTQPSGIVEKMSSAKKVFSLLTSPNENSLTQDNDDILMTFIFSCQTQANDAKLALLTEYQKYIAVLKEHNLTSRNTSSISERISALLETKQKIMNDYQVLVQLHDELILQFDKAKQEYEQHLGTFNIKTKEKRKIIKDEFTQSQQKKGLEQSIHDDYQVQLDSLTQIHDNALSNINQEIERKSHLFKEDLTKKLERTKKCHQHKLDKFDKKTEELKIMLLKVSYRKKEKSIIKTFIITEHDLTKHLAKNAALQKQIAQFEEDRAKERSQLVSKQQDFILQSENEIRLQTQAYQQTLLSQDKDLKEKIASIDAAFEHGKEKLMLDFSKKANSLGKLDSNIGLLNQKEEGIEREIAACQKNLECAADKMKVASKTFYSALEKFKNYQESYQGEIQNLLDLALEHSQSQAIPPFSAMSLILKGITDPLTYFEKAASILPTVFDHFQDKTLTPDLFNKQIMKSREIKVIPLSWAEQPRHNRVEQNIIQIAGVSCIELLTRRPLDILRTFVSHFEPTLLAEKGMKQKQSEIDKMAQSMRQITMAPMPQVNVTTTTPTATDSDSWWMNQFNSFMKLFKKEPNPSTMAPLQPVIAPLYQNVIDTTGKLPEQPSSPNTIKPSYQTNLTKYR